jgi:hypothetical protein
MASLISNSIDPQAGSNLAEAVGQALQKSGDTDEDHAAMSHEMRKAEMQYQLENAKLDLEDKKAVMVDVANARETQTRVQESDHASWLAKNIQPILSLAIVALTFYLYWYIMFGDHASLKDANSPMKDIIIYILGALTTVSTQVVSYFFGSSHGSAEKSKTLNAALSHRG